jgi:EAL domain-containing protein (putative c-di-GMP-specific phosphodiesterase class I)
VRDCATSDTDRLVIRSLVELARALGKRTVAEFVHDDATAETVRALGVDLGQGFHLGRPVPLEDVLGAR